MRGFRLKLLGKIGLLGVCLSPIDLSEKEKAPRPPGGAELPRGDGWEAQPFYGKSLPNRSQIVTPGGIDEWIIATAKMNSPMTLTSKSSLRV